MSYIINNMAFFRKLMQRRQARRDAYHELVEANREVFASSLLHEPDRDKRYDAAWERLHEAEGTAANLGLKSTRIVEARMEAERGYSPATWLRR